MSQSAMTVVAPVFVLIVLDKKSRRASCENTKRVSTTTRPNSAPSNLVTPCSAHRKEITNTEQSSRQKKK